MTEKLFPFPEKFVMYAILDHCREVQVLSDEERVLKASAGQSADFLWGKLYGELADLYLLLEDYLADKPEIIEARRSKIRALRKLDKKD